ncbi:MAG TPA: hypothetical protein VGK20_10870, partial [Candidatus Binatia bacterium]
MSSPPAGRLQRFTKALRPNRLVKILSGAAAVWLLLPDDGTDARAIHRTFSREVWRDTGLVEKAILAFGLLLWIPTSAVLIVLCTRKAGARVRSRSGKSIARQMAEQARLAFAFGIPAPWYYVFEFHDDAKRARALEYLYRQETKDALYDLMRERLS